MSFLLLVVLDLLSSLFTDHQRLDLPRWDTSTRTDLFPPHLIVAATATTGEEEEAVVAAATHTTDSHRLQHLYRPCRPSAACRAARHSTTLRDTALAVQTPSLGTTTTDPVVPLVVAAEETTTLAHLPVKAAAATDTTTTIGTKTCHLVHRLLETNMRLCEAATLAH